MGNMIQYTPWRWCGVWRLGCISPFGVGPFVMGEERMLKLSAMIWPQTRMRWWSWRDTVKNCCQKIYLLQFSFPQTNGSPLFKAWGFGCTANMLEWSFTARHITAYHWRVTGRRTADVVLDTVPTLMKWEEWARASKRKSLSGNDDHKLLHAI